MNIRSIMEAASPVMPVLTIRSADEALPLARALSDGGMRVLEITLRTPAALTAITAIREAMPQLIVGAGTVLTGEQMDAVRKAGGQFAVSPGLTEKLAAAARVAEMPFLPGVVTAGEVQFAMELGLSSLKFFPAGASGGAPLLKSYASVFPDLRFCPTGGINAANMDDYLSLPNVPCIGGSWVAPQRLLDAGDWSGITRLVTAAMKPRT